MYHEDHDFHCCSIERVASDRQRETDFARFFQDGLLCYIDGDWDSACMAWEVGYERNSKDGPLNHLYGLVKKHNNTAPEGWEKAFDWDVRAEPPEDEFDSEVHEQEEKAVSS